MKKFFKEFGEFIKRGNVLDLAVGIIIGGAFTAIVTALTGGILQPLINWCLSAIGGKDALSSAYTILSPAYDENGAIDLASSIYIDWGAFISAIINFILVAFVVFIIVKTVNKVKEEADVNAKMKARCEEKMKAGEPLTDFEQKWVKRMEKRHPEMVPALPEPEAQPAPAEPTQTEKLLTEILSELKKK